MTILRLEHQTNKVTSRIWDSFSLSHLLSQLNLYWATMYINFLFQFFWSGPWCSLPRNIVGYPGPTSGTLYNLQNSLFLSLKVSTLPCPSSKLSPEQRERSVDSVTELFYSRNNEWSSGADNESVKTETDYSRSLLLFQAGKQGKSVHWLFKYGRMTRFTWLLTHLLQDCSTSQPGGRVFVWIWENVFIPLFSNAGILFIHFKCNNKLIVPRLCKQIWKSIASDILGIFV